MVAAAGGSTRYSDYQDLYNGSLGKPIVKLVQQATQSLPSNTATALQFGAGSEVVDSHGWHDVVTNNTRITPNIPGWYRWVGTVAYGADTDLIDYYALIAKNGNAVIPQNRMLLPSTAVTSTARSLQVVVMEQANGAGDYFELMGRQVQSAAASLGTNANGVVTLAPVFECEFIRPL